MKTLVLFLSSLFMIFNAFAFIPKYKKIETNKIKFDQTIYIKSGATELPISLFKIKLSNKTYYAFALEEYGDSKIADQNDFIYFKLSSEKSEKFHKEFAKGVKKVLDSDDPVLRNGLLYINDKISDTTTRTATGTFKTCIFRKASGRDTIAIRGRCIGKYFFRDPFLAGKAGQKAKLTFQVKENTTPCDLFASIRYPIDCNRTPTGPILEFKEI